MGRLDERTALITGAAGGIGAAYAERFLDEGANVLIADISNSGADTAERLDKATPGRVAFARTDITDEASCVAAAAAAVDQFGALDILVNNAALYGDLDPLNNDVDYLRKVLDINVVGQWLMAKACVPHMITAGGGRIVNIASVAAYYWQIPAMIPADGGLGSWAYNQSKWGVVGMSRVLAAQLAQHRITSNCIAPGLTSTAATDKQVPAEFQPMFAGLNPMNATATPDDMTGVALFFASDDARLVTGQLIAVDGGGVMPS